MQNTVQHNLLKKMMEYLSWDVNLFFFFAIREVLTVKFLITYSMQKQRSGSFYHVKDVNVYIGV